MPASAISNSKFILCFLIAMVANGSVNSDASATSREKRICSANSGDGVPLTARPVAL